MIHPEDRPIHEESIRQLALKRQPFEANLRIIRPGDGGVRYINARGGPLFEDNGTVTKLTGTTFDVTQWIDLSQKGQRVS
jgi:PAS domain S-box-containing protein